ncbi:tRNA-specific adenosine deaminase 1-like [Hyalella azteca]|uniref:tRNA-specific adenosine deaminase 1 n=1 Tax=Hyalella azteca TaxID=294128 RepID=A0A8B7N855_HYAAZ|nr:tRNA-specific adenosine deaminase 1-like [Hyalella azteca]
MVQYSADFARRVAALCCAKFDDLPKSGKPQPREWTVLAGVVQCIETSMSSRRVGSKHAGNYAFSELDIHDACHARKDQDTATISFQCANLSLEPSLQERNEKRSFDVLEMSDEESDANLVQIYDKCEVSSRTSCDKRDGVTFFPSTNDAPHTWSRKPAQHESYTSGNGCQYSGDAEACMGENSRGDVGCGNHDLHLSVVALGTGTKCLGDSKWCELGTRIHDSHAEVVAKRSFQRYLMDQAQVQLSGQPSIFETIISAHGPKLKLRKAITFHLYVSFTPCGDGSIFPQQWSTYPGSSNGSMTHHMNPPESDKNGCYEPSLKRIRIDDCLGPVAECDIRMQENNPTHLNYHDIQSHFECDNSMDTSTQTDISLDTNRTGAKCAPGEALDPKAPGSLYHRHGVLRTKPGRGPFSSSHCCSDKLFRWSVLGAQGCLLMGILQCPVYFESITFGACPFNYDAINRALHTRFLPQIETLSLPDGFRYHQYVILKTDYAFKHSCEESEKRVGIGKSVPVASSVCWYAGSGNETTSNVIVEGRKQGVTKLNLLTKKGQVLVCRAQMLEKILQLHQLRYKNLADSNEIISRGMVELRSLEYRQLKERSDSYCESWRLLKSTVLRNWTSKRDNLQRFRVN